MKTKPEKLSPLGKLITASSEKCIPLNLFFELTHRCNQRCIHCCISSPTPELSTEKIKSLLNDAAEMGSLFLTLTGGEPMLRDDFFEIAHHARNRNFAVRIFTNATLIDGKTADRLIEAAPMEVDVSIHGPDAELHDGITRTPGSFDRTMRAIKLLKERGVHVSLKSMLMKQNFDRYGEIFDLADGLDVTCRVDPTITAGINGDAAPLAHRIEPARLRKIISDKRVFENIEPAPGQNVWCRVGNTEMSIAPNGDVMPCIQWRTRAGNVNEQPLRKIWEGSPVFEFLRGITAGGTPGCRDCELMSWCAKCPGIAEAEGGQWNKPYEWACTMAGLFKEMEEISPK
ncbi:MAG: radical SAM protein [bacterium]